MPVPTSVLQSLEIFNAISSQRLDDIAALGEQAPFGAGEYVIRPGSPKERVYFVKSGIVGLYVPGQNGELIPTEMCGPGNVIGVPALFERGTWQMASMTLMPSNLIAFPARRIQAHLLAHSELSSEVYEETLKVLQRRLSSLIRVLTSEDVSLTAEERCPSERSTHMVISANTRNGQVRALCQREFSCSLAEGKGCPIADKSAHDFHEIAPGRLRIAERSA